MGFRLSATSPNTPCLNLATLTGCRTRSLNKLWFYRGYLEIYTKDVNPMDICSTWRNLIDFCKFSSENQTAAGLRLPRCSYGVFSLYCNFSNTPYSTDPYTTEE